MQATEVAPITNANAWTQFDPVVPTVLEAGSLAMVDQNTPIVAGVEAAGTQRQMTVWRFYP